MITVSERNVSPVIVTRPALQTPGRGSLAVPRRLSEADLQRQYEAAQAAEAARAQAEQEALEQFFINQERAKQERLERAEAIFKRRMEREFAETLVMRSAMLPAQVPNHPDFQRKLALLLPAHNEELIIEATIKSAVAAGQALQDIYVVNDNSSDGTQELAVGALGEANVLQVGRSGKAVAVKKAIDHFDLIKRYEWLHVADADSLFGENYFDLYRAKLDPTKYAVAIGFVQSLKGNWISTYRALTYTYGQQVHRRIQSGLKMITVFPGPVTCVRTDIIKDLDYEHTGIAEDFDITLQVHRKKLGEIAYIPRAVNFTQDPQSYRDFIKQNQRWMRGYYQGVKKYGIGIHGQRIDLIIGSQMLMTLIFLLQIFVWAPYLLLHTHYGWFTILAMISLDYLINSIVALGSSVAAKRWNLLGAMPYFYFLRFTEIAIHVVSFVEIFILGKFKDNGKVGWSTAGRRYKLSAAAIADAA